MNTAKPSPRVKGGIARKKRTDGAALAAELLNDAKPATPTAASVPNATNSDSGTAQPPSPNLDSPAETTAKKEDEQTAEQKSVVRAISSAASVATGQAALEGDHEPGGGEEVAKAVTNATTTAVENGTGHETDVKPEPETSAEGAGVIAEPVSAPVQTSDKIDALLQPEAWSSPKGEPPQSSGEALLHAQSTSKDQDVEGERDEVQNHSDVNDRITVGVYLTRTARFALRRTNKSTRIPLAVLAIRAIDHAIRNGKLRELIEIRHVEPRAADSVFPDRHTRRRPPKRDGTSTSKVVQQLLMTPAEVAKLVELQETYGAENRSELLAAALEAIYDPEGVERLRSNMEPQWNPIRPPVHDLD